MTATHTRVTHHVLYSHTCAHTQSHALPCPALPCPALPCPALPCPALPCPALPCPALPCPALPALPCPALPCPALPSLPFPSLPLPLSVPRKTQNATETVQWHVHMSVAFFAFAVSSWAATPSSLRREHFFFFSRATRCCAQHLHQKYTRLGGGLVVCYRDWVSLIQEGFFVDGAGFFCLRFFFLEGVVGFFDNTGAAALLLHLLRLLICCCFAAALLLSCCCLSAALLLPCTCRNSSRRLCP